MKLNSLFCSKVTLEVLLEYNNNNVILKDSGTTV